MINVMVDIETFGNKMGSPVLSIGAVYKGEQEYEKFYCTLNLDAQLKKGMLPNQDTIAWWMGQSEGAKKVFQDLPDVDNVSLALNKFREFLPTKGQFRFWGYGANFDEPMLEALYTKYNMETPWRYCDSFCFRTLKKMFPIFEIPDVDGPAHNALADAEWQFNYLEALIEKHGVKFND